MSKRSSKSVQCLKLRLRSVHRRNPRRLHRTAKDGLIHAVKADVASSDIERTQIDRTQIDRTIDAVWRMESARVIAGLTRVVRDVGIAEELAQDALVAALEQWPASGIPQNPGAWLMAAAKHRAIDLLRRNTRLEQKHEELARELEEQQQRSFSDFATALAAAADGDIEDDLLRLIFISCHPVLSPESRAALTLRLLGGIT